MAKQNVRVRFAPSPTGPLHIGGVRTALFNCLFAKKHNGTFILRIEDTDRQRYVNGTEEYFIEALKWCGIEIDEGVSAGGPHVPYRQSERKDLYRRFATELVKSGHAYIAFDTPEELEELRNEKEKEGGVFQYDHTIRTSLQNSLALPAEEVEKLTGAGVPHVIRFCMPEDREVTMNDIIRGEIRVNTSTLDDKVLFKADGMPTYHLANVADDHLMQISHVIRGEEWLPSLPLHVLLYEALGWEDSMPEFAHLPLLLKPGGQGKLSKRDGERLGFPVFPLRWKDPVTGEVSAGYRESGYFPEAFVNLLALLGWNPGTDQEIFSLEELAEDFSLDRVHHAGARFDPDKARWFNHQYLMKMDNRELAAEFLKVVKKKGYDADKAKIEAVAELVKERADFVNEMWEQSSFFFERPGSYDEKLVKKRWKEDTPGLLGEIISILAQTKPFDAGSISASVKEYLEKEGIGLGNVMIPLRLALVGEGKGPDLFRIIELLGREESIDRIRLAIEKLQD
ncbi:MAG: glutamate--tRNA ligase [Bacteroidales bacterium]